MTRSSAMSKNHTSHIRCLIASLYLFLYCAIQRRHKVKTSLKFKLHTVRENRLSLFMKAFKKCNTSHALFHLLLTSTSNKNYRHSIYVHVHVWEEPNKCSAARWERLMFLSQSQLVYWVCARCNVCKVCQ